MADMLISLNRVEFRSKKWYNRIFPHMMDISVNNAWVLYKREYKILIGDEAFMPLKEFRLDLARALFAVAKIQNVASGNEGIDRERRPTVTKPHDETRFDHVGTHMPMMSENKERHRCKFCSLHKTTMVCSKCNVHLCIVRERNCFIDYHTLEKTFKCKT